MTTKPPVNNIFTLGQKVTSKKLGLPIIGTIAGCILGKAFRLLDNNNGDNWIFDRWTFLYPDWENEFVMQVIYTELCKPYSLDEYIWYYKEVYDFDDLNFIKESYSRCIKLPGYHYPKNDLEVYNEEVVNVLC